MDIRRLRLWLDRTATLMDNDLVRILVEDEGGMGIEFASHNATGGWENCAYLPPFRPSMTNSVLNDPNAPFWKHDQVLYHLAGSYFSFPDFAPAPTYDHEDGSRLEGAEASVWAIRRYGSDNVSGGVWLVSRQIHPDWQVRKLDLLLPGQYVHYTATKVTNTSTEEKLVGNAVWSVNIGSPFLETGCVLNSCAKTWTTAPDTMDQTVRHLLAMGVQFDDLGHAPSVNGKAVDYTVVPPPNGHCDFISGRVPRTSKLGWSSVINPRQQMMLFNFFPGPAALKSGDLPVNFINFHFNYGGRGMTPDAFYHGGVSQAFSLDCGAGTNLLDLGLDASKAKGTLMGADTTVTLEPGESKTLFYASAFLPYEAPRIGLNFYSVDRVGGGLLVKRTKSSAFIACDPEFEALRGLIDRLGQERDARDGSKLF